MIPNSWKKICLPSLPPRTRIARWDGYLDIPSTSRKKRGFTSKFKITLLTLFASGILVSCSSKEEVTQYKVAKQQTPAPAQTVSQAQPAAAPMSPTPGLEKQTAGFSIPKWQAPKDWTAQALGSMRKGSWLISKDNQQAEVSVLAFPGDVGGTTANINRWRSQIGLKTETESTIAQELQPIDVGDKDGSLITLLSPPSFGGETSDQAIIAAIVPTENGTWFFKMIGSKQLVLEQESSFKEFLNSVQF